MLKIVLYRRPLYDVIVLWWLLNVYQRWNCSIGEVINLKVFKLLMCQNFILVIIILHLKKKLKK